MNVENCKAYELIMTEELPDISSVGTILRHKKSGARIMLIENDDENKVFNIAFRTTPKDSTGVAHIMEHSVLCGSREFPLKDPFVELVKGSLNTFLNAMTYPDKTCYPVASCNDQDFQNLMHVYLDAVFYPNVYKREEIFRQEGWHYHLESPDGPLAYNGVVYNEMKGAFSSSDEVLEREIMNSLFPDTTYGLESGGDPAVIPQLTYEAFLDFHRTYYHPSNSYIYLYGNMDMEEKLAFIDEHYLSAFDNLKVDSEIGLQQPFKELRDIEKEYPVSEDEGEEDNTYLSYNMVCETANDPLLCTAFEILDYALMSAPGAPLKMALLSAGIGKDIYGSYDDGILQPYFSVISKGANASQKEEFLSIIRSTLSDIAEKGIDKAAILAGINYYEFRYREADFGSMPKGLILGLAILGSWLYSDDNPFAQVKQLPQFEYLKSVADKGYFEELIRKYLLNNPHGSVLTLVPKTGLAVERDKALADELQKKLSAMTLAEREAMVQKTEALAAYQEEEDSPEVLSLIPLLKRSDIKRECAPVSNEPIEENGNLFLYHPVRSSGIGYLDLLMEFKDFTPDDIHYLAMLKSTLGYIDTENYEYGALFNRINANSGGIIFGTEVFENKKAEGGYQVFFGVRAKALYHQAAFVYDMVKEILFASKLDDKTRLKEIVSEQKSRTQTALLSAGHATAVMRASSYASKESVFQDELSGLGYYMFIEDLDKNFDEKIDNVIAGMKKLLSRLLRKDALIGSYTGERESMPEERALFGAFAAALSDEPVPERTDTLVCEKKNEGFTTSGQVQYVGQTGNYIRQGFAYTGALDILRTILSYDYLWMNIRVKGGAYGCSSAFKRNGEGYFSSYRDPHLKRTLDVFAKTPDYIRAFDADEREMTKYIIGTISNRDVPRTPKMQGNISKIVYMEGRTDEERQKERDQILDATAEDIRALAPLVESVLKNGQICVVGSETGIEKDKDALDIVLPMVHG